MEKYPIVGGYFWRAVRGDAVEIARGAAVESIRRAYLGDHPQGIPQEPLVEWHTSETIAGV
ncbi:MAG: hypothetical protein PT944_02405 [Actinomycetaceae bacterium]|nr:hypothetical protein [Arcanobacterium sp.]MDD7686755.1 hypothetical protein [Actinomycetaceae bacterium]MDY5272567.1 hypothetical protein [Arcanobacterium sp.]